MFSLQSLVDLVTVVPMVAAFWVDEGNKGFVLFSKMVRIFRILRVFRIFRWVWGISQVGAGY